MPARLCAVLELVRQAFCQHVRVLPEAASLVFGGGFPRGELLESRRAAQRAIFHVQRELEREAEAHGPAIVLCDRGTVDGLAYWPGDADQLWSEVASDEARELTRYAAVIHLATPSLEYGYNHQNPLRVENPTTAAEIDARHSARVEAPPQVPDCRVERRVPRQGGSCADAASGRTAGVLRRAPRAFGPGRGGPAPHVADVRRLRLGAGCLQFAPGSLVRLQRSGHGPGSVEECLCGARQFRHVRRLAVTGEGLVG